MDYEITVPDGRKFIVTAPEGASQEEVLSFAQQNWDRKNTLSDGERQAIDKDMQRLANPTGSFAENFNAGMGKAFTDIGRGAAQLVGMGPDAQEMQEIRKQDAPLMKTGGGLTGNISGNVAVAAPAMMIPGVNSVAGAGAMGATLAALQPTDSPTDRLKNMGVGGALGAGSQYLGTTGAKMLGERQATQAAQQSRNAVNTETLRRGQEAGYVVPPSSVNPSAVNRILESLAGKAATNQAAAQKNMGVTDELARRAAGLGPNEALSKEALRASRQRMAAPYREVASLSPKAAADLEALKQARFDSKLQWKGYNRVGDPKFHEAATAADKQVAALNQSIEQAAAGAGRQDLVKALNEARTNIARNRQVQEALNVGSGRVDPAVIGRALDRGSPLSGELETIGRMQQAFPQSMRDMSGQQAAGTNQLMGVLAPLMGGAVGHTAGGIPGAIAGAAPFVVPAGTRQALLSGPGQRMLASPPKPGQAIDPELAAFLARALIPPTGMALQQTQP